MSQCQIGTYPTGLPQSLPASTLTAPLVSVCIINWNCRELLRACLRSLLEQAQGVSLEVIVVDNASSDGAAAMVACEFPEVTLIPNQDNTGFADGNNQAARIARGQFLFFLNNDTVIPARALEKLVAYLQAHPGTVIVGPRLRDNQGKIQISYRRRPTIATFLHRTLLLRWTGLFRENYHAYRREAPAGSSLAQPVDVLMGAALLTRREQFLQMGAWDEDFAFGGEDLELCLRAKRWGQVVYLPAVEITHHGRASTRRNIAYASPCIAKGFVQFFRKSGASPSALLGYKFVITLDIPLQILSKASQYLLRRLLGRPREAEQSLNALRGLMPFLGKGLWHFWQA